MPAIVVFPHPVAIELGPFAIRWYALAYIAGLAIGWRVARRTVQWAPPVATPLQLDDFLTWATLGVVIGGRLGYVLFYQPSRFFAEPLQIFEVWQGGMSFHGGMLGVAIVIIAYCGRQKISILGFADRIAMIAPLGLALGRVANFVNGELWGRPAPDGWPGAMIFFPGGGPTPRYPSQLYEAFLEGVVLLTVMLVLGRRESLRARLGLLTGVFLIGYGLTRITAEFFREPDAFLGFIRAGATMGQLLSAPMLLAGGWLIFRTRTR